MVRLTGHSCLYVLISVFSFANSYKLSLKHNETFACVFEGRFPDISDCTSYYECIPDGNSGKLKSFHRDCMRGGYHPKKRKCVSTKELKNCSARKSKMMTPYRPDLDYECETKSEFCLNCKGQGQCIEGKAFIHNCEFGTVCRDDIAGNFKDTAVCYVPGNSDCNCPDNGNLYKKDPHRDTSFIHCDENGMAEVSECTEGKTFDDDEGKCIFEGKHKRGCTKSGKFVDPDDCSKYHSCIETRNGWLMKTIKCEKEKTFFDEDLDTCISPCEEKEAEEGNCPKGEGRFQNPKNCRKYRECIQTEKGFRTISRSCPPSYHWKEKKDGKSGNCIAESLSECDAVRKSKKTCQIPEGWCKSKGSDKPDEESSKPDEESDKPDEESDMPDEESDKPDDESDKPDEESDKPDEESDKPDEESDKPDEEPGSPNEDSDRPDEEPGSPNEDSGKPDEEPGSPSEDPNPSDEQPGPPSDDPNRRDEESG